MCRGSSVIRVLLLVTTALVGLSSAVNWNGNNWALKCDFPNESANFKSVRQPKTGEHCGGTCVRTKGCTHFTWSLYRGGTCWLKKGPIRFSDAVDVSKWTACGVIRESSGGRPKPKQTQPPKRKQKPSTSNLDSLRNQVLNAYNRLRARHGSAPLRLSGTINAYAQRRAEYMARNNVFAHISGNPYGENLYMSSGGSGRLNVDSAMQGLYWNEEKKFNYNSGGFSMATGHFTAIVWRNTKYLGVGVASRGSKVYLVTNFDPPGNYRGQFRANVKRPR